MNVTLASILTKVNNGSAGQTDAAAAASVSRGASIQRANAILESLHVGQTITGQIKSMNGSQILLELAQGVEINAKMDSGIEVPLGKNLSFEVKTNQQGKVSLSPLYTNLSTEGNAGLSALKAAGLPASEQNVAMVKSMMEEGMPIDKGSLWEMAKTISSFPGAQAETIVRLQSMDIPLTENNVVQYEITQNMQNKLLDSMQEMTDGMDEIFANLSQEGEVFEGLSLMRDVAKLFPEVLQEQVINSENLGTEVGEAAGADTTGNFVSELQQFIHQISELAKQEEADTTEESSIQNNSGLKEAQLENAKTENPLGVNEKQAQKTEQLKIGDKVVNLTEEDKQALVHKFDKLTKDFSKRFQNVLQDKWTLEPQTFADKEEVKRFYQRLLKETGDMTQVLTEHGKADSSAGKSAGQMQQNLQFIQDINQAFPYLQIPLKASMENAQGELFVYSRKQGKVSEDGSSSALLHLDMEHLGSMDIYVTLKEKNVSTQFTLENDEVLGFIADNIHILSKQLEKKGYHLDTEMKKKDAFAEKIGTMDRIRGVDGQETAISYTSFDVRA